MDALLAGTVCGVQNSMQAMCETMSFLVALYLSDPQLFSLLMLGSLGVTGLAALLYTAFLARHQMPPELR